MPNFPQYNRQVFTNPGRNRLYRQESAPHFKFNKESFNRMSNIEDEIEDIKRRSQVTQALLQGASIIGGVIEQTTKARAATQVREATIGATAALDEFYAEMKNDPDYETYGDRFEKRKEEIYKASSENITFPWAKKNFDIEFEGTAAKYQNQLQALALEKDYANGVASMNWQIDKAVEMGDIDKVRDILFGYSYNAPQGKRAKVTETYVPGAVENGYVTEPQALKIAEAAVYTVNKNKAWNTLQDIEPNAAKKIIQDRENGQYVFAPFLSKKDRSSMAERIQNAIDDQEREFKERKDNSRDKYIGNLYKEYNNGTLSKAKIRATQTLWEKDWGFVDEDTGKELKTLMLLLDNKAAERDRQKQDTAEAFFNLLENRVQLGETSSDEALAYGESFLKDNLGSVESDRYEEFRERITNPVQYIPEDLIKNIEKNYNGTGTAIGSIAKGGNVKKHLTTWVKSIMFDENGDPTGKQPSREEIENKMNDLMMPDYFGTVSTLLEENLPEYMYDESLTGALQYYTPPGADKRKPPKDFKEEEFNTTTSMEKLVGLFEDLLSGGALDELSPQNAKMIQPYAKKLKDTYTYWFTQLDPLWDAKRANKRDPQIDWIKGVVPVWTNDRDEQYILRFNPVTQAEYFQRAHIYSNGTIGVWNASEQTWEVLRE